MRISVVLPILAPTSFLKAMTEFAIKTLRLHADNPFELIVVEAGEPYFDPSNDQLKRWMMEGDGTQWVDKYLNFNPKIGGVKELNAGIDAASCEFVLSTGNDVIVPPHWDTELLRVFDERKDCGAASLSAFEPGAIVGPPVSQDMIVEGFYTPFIMFHKGQRFDEAYRKIYQDSDFIMRLYERGLRAYRSCRAHVHHLNRMTSDRVDPDQYNRDLAKDERLFYARWGDSPLAVFNVIRHGYHVWGREWERPEIHLHHDPNKAGD